VSSSQGVTESAADEMVKVNDAKGGVSIQRPDIHWTVPGMKLGYRDEETGEWFDEDGPRNGPTTNYWRQSSDEKEYKKDMDVLDAAIHSCDFDLKITALEKRRKIRFPFKSRKLLGTWAPVLNAGEKVAYDNNSKIFQEGTIDCSLLIEILRPGGPKYGEKHRYGTFYAPLEDGEEVKVRSSDFSLDTTFCASKDNDIILQGKERTGLLKPPIRLGSITYLSDYILIQRRPDGKVDLWLRADKSHLGKKSNEDEKKEV